MLIFVILTRPVVLSHKNNDSNKDDDDGDASLPQTPRVLTVYQTVLERAYCSHMLLHLIFTVAPSVASFIKLYYR